MQGLPKWQQSWSCFVRAVQAAAQLIISWQQQQMTFTKTPGQNLTSADFIWCKTWYWLYSLSPIISDELQVWRKGTYFWAQENTCARLGLSESIVRKYGSKIGQAGWQQINLLGSYLASDGRPRTVTVYSHEAPIYLSPEITPVA